MDEAKERLDLTAVHRFLERWRWIAVSAQDPDAHRRMMDVAARLERGEDVSTTPWNEVKNQMGL